MNTKEKDTLTSAQELASQCWCDKETSGIEMDDRLATSFALRLIDKIDHIKQLIAHINQLEQKIQKLIDAGDVMYKLLEPPSISMRTSTVDNALQGWDDAKIR